VVVDDVHFAQKLRARLIHAMKHEGQRVDPGGYANRPLQQRLLDRMAFVLMRIGVFLSGNRY
jgi:cardiolipin synthase